MIALFFTGLVSFLLTQAVPIIVYLLAAFGISFTTYTSFNFLLEKTHEYITSRFAGMPSNVLDVLYMINVDDYIEITFTAMTTRALMVGLLNGTRKVWSS